MAQVLSRPKSQGWKPYPNPEVEILRMQAGGYVYELIIDAALQLYSLQSAAVVL
jgi:hypothetical protein